MKNGKILKRIIGSYVVMCIVLGFLGFIAVMAEERSQSQYHHELALFLAILTGVIYVWIIRSAYLTVKAIKTPLIYLTEVTKSIEVGDVDVEIRKAPNDEFGILYEGYTTMIETIKESAKFAEEIAKGNLTINPKIHSDKDVLGKSLKDLIDGNNVTLGSIKESSLQLTAGAGQVASASQALAQGSTEQASAIQEITASMTEIAQKTNDNASLANNVDQLVQQMAVDTQKGSDQMSAVVMAMEDISRSSQSISKVIKTIDDIAFQTNILALNATVEAARAGVHGKGFAVVAEEVKNLAEKSSEAAQETAELIQDSIDKVESGSKNVIDLGNALDSIKSSMQEIVESVSSIAVASNNQATAVAQINQAIDQVSQVVQTNSATSEECAAASEQLSNQSQNLRDMIGRYRLKNIQTSNISFENSYAADTYGNETMMSDYEDDAMDYESIISLDGNTGKF